MVEVAAMTWSPWTNGQTFQWRLQIEFGAIGEEVPMDQMLEGRGHSVLPVEALVKMVQELSPEPCVVVLYGHPPAGVVSRLLSTGYLVQVTAQS